MTQQITTTPLTFTVRRQPPELIVPTKPTPRELKPLSDIDDQEGLRFHIPFFHIYGSNPKMGNKNPASVIREALAKALVFYYPFAGRLKEGPTRKLMVDCSGEEVLFIEAEADVTLEQFRVALQPPFPCREELLYDVPGSSGILDSQLLLIQVTRLLYAGFILTVRFNHTICDGFGYAQFMTTLSEVTNGASVPSIFPLWQREMLCAREVPHVTCTHHEYDEVADTNGYYGNVFGFPAAISKAQDICNKPLGYALELVMKAKSEVTKEYMRSITDLMVIRGRSLFTTVGSYIISDLTRFGLLELDFGWGKSVYAGPDFHVASFYTRYIKHKGESGILVPVWLSTIAMKRFVEELGNMLTQDIDDHVIQEDVSLIPKYNIPAMIR
uniref:Putative transferase, Chloramphenicol acetyltransferase-like domain protein n=1 Tax=Helianthus annuus TaxID=4232 RepID=A0A251TE38_HELAN